MRTKEGRAYARVQPCILQRDHLLVGRCSFPLFILGNKLLWQPEGRACVRAVLPLVYIRDVPF